METLSAVLCPAAIIFVLALGLLLLRTGSGRLVPNICLAGLAGIAGVLALGALSGSVSDVTYVAGLPGQENAERLATTVSLLHGYKIYNMPAYGPSVVSVYPPVAYLFYLPAALLRVPIPYQVIASSGLAMLFCLLPVLLIIRTTRANAEAAGLAVVLYLLSTFYFRSLYFSTTSTYPDAPSLGFAALAALFLFNGKALTWRRLALAGFCCACSGLSKQTMFYVPLLLAGMLWLACGIRVAAKFLAWTAGIGVAMLLVFGAYFGFHALFLHMIQLKNRMPWWVAVYPYGFDEKLPGTYSLKGKLKAIVTAFDIFLPARWLLLPLCGAIVARAISKLRSTGGRLRLSVVFFALAVGLAPIAVVSRAMAGGVENSYSVFDYFALLGLVCLFLELAVCKDWLGTPLTSEPGDWARVTIYAVCVMLCFSLNFQLVRTRRYFSFLKQNPLKQLEEFDRKWPGKAYFVSGQLETLRLTGTLYHDSEGLAEKVTAAPESIHDHAAVARNFPRNFDYLVAGPLGTLIQTEFFPEYNRLTYVPELSYWKVYTRGDQAPAN